MKEIVIFLVMLIPFFIVSCNDAHDDHIEPQMPRTKILSISTSANSANITWEDVSTDSEPCYYSVNLYKPKYQSWWDNNADYYQLDDNSPDNLLYVEGERWDKYPHQYVDVNEIDSTDKTSIVFDNLEKSTVYMVFVTTNGNGMVGISKSFFFRTKEE